MTYNSSFQPFLIGSGQSKTGLFQYLESWIKPEDAFDDIQDAYVNRGQIWKRAGQTLLGRLKYCNSQVLTHGTGGLGPYSGTMDNTSNTPRGGHLPIVAGSVVVRTRVTTPNTEVYSDNSAGGLTGNLGGTGTINYTTGAWSITSAIAVTANTPIMISYDYEPTTATNPHVNVSVVAIGDGVAGAHSGTFTQNVPMEPGSVFIVAQQSNGEETYLDNGGGGLVGSLLGTGTINYSTGAWSFTPTGVNTVTTGTAIQLGFSRANPTFGIMGINQWNDETNNTFKLTVEDTRRLSVFNQAGNTFDAVCEVAETLFVSDGTTLTFTNSGNGYTATFGLITPLSITITTVNTVTGVPIDTTKDDGQGLIVGSGGIASGTIDYYTGAFSITVNPALTQGFAINATFTLQNDYFFGDTSNFFNWTNWFYPTNLIPIAIQVLDGAKVVRPTQFHDGFLYLTNNFDPVTLFNGTTLSRPAFAIQQSQLGLGKNEITKCLDIKTYALRLLFVRPSTTNNNSLPEPQGIRWSAQFQPTNTVADIPGSGGELSAATGDWIQSAKFLKDFLIVYFQNSTWNFRFTGNSFNPFVFYKIDSTKTVNAPYASIEFEDRVTSMGTKGFIECDGNGVDRYDLKVFDLYNDVNTEVFRQCFGLRFDALNQSWMLYPDMDTDEQLSNKVFLYNYIEDSWSVFNMALSCLGMGFGIRDITWAMMSTTTWAQEDNAWNSYLEQQESLRLLGGSHDGLVLQLNDGVTDNDTSFFMQFTTKKYNPFIDKGMKAQFGYLDVYYTVDAEVTLTFDFFIDNNTANAIFQRKMTLTGEVNAPYSWQRIFINVQTQFLQFKCYENIVDNSVGDFRILGMILWASPAGRLIQ